ncbi:MAG: hypothetical protein HQL67_04120 [Magnetococcales bacterium]|nr:hypothetical protein [Magnetococcales bacterium]
MKPKLNHNQMDILHDLLLGVGKMQGALETIQNRQQEQTKWMGTLDDRLRRVEKKAALNGLMAGGMVGIIIGVVGHFAKNFFGLNG